MNILDPKLEEAIEDVIADFTDTDKTFTAYDVTKEVRARGCPVMFKHSQVRGFIHDTMDDYVDDDTYKREQHPQLPALQYVPVVPVVVIPTPVINSNTLSRDGRGRVCLLRQDIVALGASTGDTLYMGKSNGVIVIGFKSNLGATPIAHYKVDRDDNVRISAGTLEKVGIPRNQASVSCQNNGSVIMLA